VSFSSFFFFLFNASRLLFHLLGQRNARVGKGETKVRPEAEAKRQDWERGGRGREDKEEEVITNS
jgi:hypothetical protein